MNDGSTSLRRIVNFLIGTSVPSLAVGYATFYSIFPSESFPVTSDASVAWILLVLLFSSIIGAMGGEDLRMALLASFAAIPVGLLIALLFTFAPAFSGTYLLEPSAVPFFVAHNAVFVLALAFPINLFGAVLGQVVRDRIRLDLRTRRLAR